MLTKESAERFADEWCDAWNSHDLERILSHWRDDCVFSSPFIVKLLGDPTGTVRGKQALRDYWRRGLDANPDLHFRMQAVFVGHDSVVLGYLNHRDQSCGEWVRLDEEGYAVAGGGHYAG